MILTSVSLKMPHTQTDMTLSHCWGKAEFLKLTKSTLGHVKTGFKREELPKTFRDAVDITRVFDVRHLWIDALCIVQDSAEDWNRESAEMMNVYEHSYCNIAATGAFNSEQGCFFQRDPSFIPPILVQSQWNDALILSYHVIHDSMWDYHVTTAPLNLR
jgi:hypothetical protein